jgi:hypothetical protein
MHKRRYVVYFLVLLLIGCSGTKETRRSNKAARKLERLVYKFPELEVKDTLRATVKYIKPKTTLEIKTGKHLPDSISWRENDAQLIRVVRNDSVFYTVICDTIHITQEIEIPYKTIQPIKYLPLPLKWWQKILIFLGVVFLAQMLILWLKRR